MSETLSYPAEGISQLVIDDLAADAVVRGVLAGAAIQVTFATPAEPDHPGFELEEQGLRFQGATVERILAPEELSVVAREALGDLRVQGLAGRITIEAVRGDLRLVALAGQVLLAQADADIRAERVGELRILGACHGDLRFADGGLLAAETVVGDLRLDNAASAQLGHLHGDLWAEKLTGSLNVRQADGDVRLSDIDGLAAVKGLAGDLRGQGLSGGLTASQVRGDAVLGGPFVAGAEYAVTSDGDIHLTLPGDADVKLSVQASGRIRSPFALTPAADGTAAFSASLGQGASRITLSCLGDLRINQEGGGKASRWERRGRRQDDPFAELSNLGDRIRQQVTASLASAGINMETGEASWGWERGRGPRGRGPTPPAAPERPRPPAPPRASGEEQMAILKMVEEGRLTPEEADKLLRALGA